MTTKTCNKCNEAKSTTEFYKRKKANDGLQPICKICDGVKRRSYDKQNPERAKANGLKFLASLTLPERLARACVTNTMRRSKLSSRDLFGGLTFTEACNMTVPFTKERLRLEAETGVAHNIDHIIPLSSGGTHTLDNLQVLTEAENKSKGAVE